MLTQPGHPFVDRCRHAMHYTSHGLQCKLVSGWGLQKWRSVLPCGPMWLRKGFTFTLLNQYKIKIKVCMTWHPHSERYQRTLDVSVAMMVAHSWCSGWVSTSQIGGVRSVFECSVQSPWAVIACAKDASGDITLLVLHRGYMWNKIIAQRRSVAKSVGCLQWHLFVVRVCVCLFVSTITSERVNVGWWNLGVGALYKILDQVRIWGSYPSACAPAKMWRWAMMLRKLVQAIYTVSTKKRPPLSMFKNLQN